MHFIGRTVLVLAATGITGLGSPGCTTENSGSDVPGDDGLEAVGDTAMEATPAEVLDDAVVEAGDLPAGPDGPDESDLPPADGTIDSDTGPDGGCDWMTSAGCEPTQKCAFGIPTPTCGPAGTGGDYANCATTGDAFCARGFTCLTTSGTENDTSICRANCRDDADCPAQSGQLCLQLSADVQPMFCSRVRRCDPFGDGCESGDGCYPALFNDGTPICLNSGKKDTGESCGSLSECKKGSVCVPGDPPAQGTCRDLCAMGTTCTGGAACVELPPATLGICP